MELYQESHGRSFRILREKVRAGKLWKLISETVHNSFLPNITPKLQAEIKQRIAQSHGAMTGFGHHLEKQTNQQKTVSPTGMRR